MSAHVGVIALHARRTPPALEQNVREHLEHLLRSPKFDASTRSREFLSFVVEEALAGRGARLNQGAIAVTVFGRGADFDAVLDPIVRVQAGRLRRSLERYYLLSGRGDRLRIELPKGGYAPVFVPSPRDANAEPAIEHSVLEQVIPWPTVIVRRFDVDADDCVDAAARLDEELTREMCRYGDVRVVRQRDLGTSQPSTSSLSRFELMGRLRRDADGHLVGARLVDRTSGEQLWSDEFHTQPRTGLWSCSLDDIGRVIAARVGAEQGVIVRTLASQHIAHAAPGGAFGTLLRVHRLLLCRKIDEAIPTIEAVQRLTAREPEVALGWMYLSRLYVANHCFELSTLSTPLEKAIDAAYQGLLLEPASTRARCVLAAALFQKGELRAARDELEQALALNGDSLVNRELIGWLLALAGDWDRGVAVMRDAMSRNPYCLPHVNHGLWAHHLRRGEYAEAHLRALEYRDSAFFWRDLMITCSLGLLGRIDEARVSATQLLLAKPGFHERGRTLIGYFIKDRALSERIEIGLSKAGLRLG
jgi:adenylate cyclase